MQLRSRRVGVVLVHLAGWSLSLAGAFLLRFDFAIPPEQWSESLLIGLPALLACRLLVFTLQGQFREMWRYSSLRDALYILRGTSLASLLFAATLLFLRLDHFPRSILFIEWLLAVLMLGALRLAPRAVRYTAQMRRLGKGRRMLIVGAGDAGEMLVREILKTYLHRFEPVGFLDDDPKKLGARIHGIPVLGRLEQAPEVVAETNATEIIVAIPSASGEEMRRILACCKPAGVPTRVIRGLDVLMEGHVTPSQIRDVQIEDLLGRKPIRLETTEVGQLIRGRVVMVTGAGGSIGSEICRQLLHGKPARLVLVEQAENNLFHIHRELAARFPEADLVPCIADICDARRMEALLKEHAPVALFHAAAHKHVPMMEWNPGEAVKNNVLGTKTLADLADRQGVERFVMISTDKAVNPTSVMGATKRIAEMYVQSLSRHSRTRFVTVRFGNVLGSAGSVIPLFKEQIARGGPVTVTHPEMRRYFMTIPEASQLVLQAGAMGSGGEIFILDMGEPVKIVDLARELITLSGFVPEVDIPIEFSGMRPGEKLFEELSTDAECADKTRHPDIFVGKVEPRPWDEVRQEVADLVKLGDAASPLVRAKIAAMVPEYRRLDAANEGPAAAADSSVKTATSGPKLARVG